MSLHRASLKAGAAGKGSVPWSLSNFSAVFEFKIIDWELLTLKSKAAAVNSGLPFK